MLGCIDVYKSRDTIGTPQGLKPEIKICQPSVSRRAKCFAQIASRCSSIASDQ